MGKYLIILVGIFLQNVALSNDEKITQVKDCISSLETSKFYRFPYPASWETYLSSVDASAKKEDSLNTYLNIFTQISSFVENKGHDRQFFAEETLWMKKELRSASRPTIAAREAIYRRAIDLTLEYDLPIYQSFNTAFNEFYHPNFHDKKWIKKINKYARTLALKAHDKQLYSDDEKYSFHLHGARNAYKRYFPVTSSVPELLQLKVGLVLWLHDILEDTNVTLADIYYLFGDEIGFGVFCITNIPPDPMYDDSVQEPSQIKLQRKVESKRLTVKSKLARLGKIADRITNMEESVKNFIAGKSNCLPKYLSEWPSFYKILYIEGEAEPAWQRLSELVELGRSLAAGSETTTKCNI